MSKINNLKSEKGITMIILTIGIIILATLTSMLVYYSSDGTQIKKLKNMYNDIEILEEKVSLYNYDYQRIPILTEYEDAKTILGEQASNLDNDKYYIIDLSKLENVSLNYGKDFENIKSKYKTEGFNLNSYQDVYVVNEESLRVYYIRGVKAEKSTYHTQIKNEEDIELKVTKISSIEDLIRFGQNVLAGETYENKYVVITRSLDFENINSYDGTEILISGVTYKYGGENNLQTYLSKEGTGFTPIGTSSAQFKGIFDGQNYKISNIYNSTKEFFSTAGNKGTIKGIENIEWKE